MPAESPAPSAVFLAFVGGFALATLIFWPMLHRARSRTEQSSAPTGKHARRPEQQKAIEPKAIEQRQQPTTAKQQDDSTSTGNQGQSRKVSTGATAVTVPATVSATAVTAAGSAAEGSEEGATPSPPSTTESAPSDGAEAPAVKDLFEEHYGPKFDLVRDRLVSLREQINGEC